MLYEIKNKFYKYQKNIFSIISSVSDQEYEFILNTLSLITKKDLEKKAHISAYSFPIIIHKNSNKINPSRITVGTKTNFRVFGRNASLMLNSLNISETAPKGFEWYGIGWDIENDEIKIYFLKKDFSEIKCKEYQRSSALKIREKEYKIGVETTKMKKDGETIKQINANKESFDYEIVHKMTSLGFSIDTYSEYTDKLTVYFD